MGGHKRAATGFGARLKELREAAKLSQAQLAEQAGMNVFGIAKLEQGQREPSWATVQSLAKALGVDCTAFAGCEDIAGEDGGGGPSAKTAKGAAKKKRGKK